MTLENERPSIWSRIPGWAGAAAALVALMVFTSILEPSFLRPTNLINILNQNSSIGIVAVGMTMVIILGGIDLSVGSLLAMSGGLGIVALKAVALSGGGPTTAVTAGVLVTLLCGMVAGALNGILVSYGRIAPFIATLGALSAYRSIATWIANGGQFTTRNQEGVTDASRILHAPAEAFAALGRGMPIPGTNISRTAEQVIPMELPYSILVWLVVVIVTAILLNRTRFGRYVIAIGSNERTAVYSAIAVSRIKLLTYTLMGLITGIAALVTASRYESVNSANTGILLELEAIAAVVIGGTRMSGGRGSLAGTVLGVLLLGVIKNVLVMLQVTSHAHGLVMGLIIIAAVLVQRIGRRG